MDVVYALTRNYYHKLYPSIKSLIEHNKDAEIYILAEDDEVPNLPCKAHVINVSDQDYFDKEDINYKNWFTYINLLKVCYPSLLPDLHKVIHLDVDTVILGDISPMLEPLDGHVWVAAVPEYNGTYNPFAYKRYELYFNMGVAAIDLDAMRRDNAEPYLVSYLKMVKQPWADQDAWNLFGLAMNKFALLNTKYNENRMTYISKDPIIVHYCSHHDWYESSNVPRHEYLLPYLNSQKSQ